VNQDFRTLQAEESYFDDTEQFMALQKQAVDEIARS
jgi:hypothetical protein